MGYITINPGRRVDHQKPNYALGVVALLVTFLVVCVVLA